MDKDPCCFTLFIGGERLTVATDGIAFPDPLYPNPAYSFFTSLLPGTDFCKTDVLVTASPPPNLSVVQWLFNNCASVDDSGGASWSAGIHDGLVYIKFAGLSSCPLWVARFLPDASRVTVFCGKEIIDANKKKLLLNPVTYPLDQILLMYGLAGRGAVCHGAGWLANNSGLVFAGVSGAGKTTIANLLAQNKSGRLLSDDRVIICEEAGKFYVYGTPWPGEGGYAKNERSTMNALFFLARGDENRIEPVSPAIAASLILPVLSIPWYDADITTSMLDFCDRLVSRVPAYRMAFTPDDSVADEVLRFVKQTGGFF
ncbi:MAG: hypothetical protein GXP53_01145 [Deltaproteobacteria bacterium]|nr:hypothetical protein [Deltaproteobacteria bacterium]